MKLRVTYMALSMAILFVLPLLLSVAFEHIDKENTIKLGKKDTIWFIVVSIGLSIGFEIVAHMNLVTLTLTSFIMAYLIFMSYTDQKTKQVYSAVSLVVFLVAIVICMLQIMNRGMYSIFNVGAMICLNVLLVVLGQFGLLGMGDVDIYGVIGLFYLQTRPEAFFSIILNLLLANILFGVSAIARKARHKDKLPFTLYIAISTGIMCVIGI